MKKYFVLLLFSSCLYMAVKGQTVIAGNISATPKDPTATLEVQKPLRSKINIRSGGYADTSWIQLSNRNATEQGTDFNIVAIREAGLYFSTASDLPEFANDSLLTLLRMGNVGIGTTAPAARLDVIGNIRMQDGNQASGKVMTSSNNGQASWQPKTFGFAATGSFPAISNRQTIPSATNTQINVINLEEYDANNIYNAATGVVTIAEAGVYHIDVSITYSQASNGIYSLSLVNSVGTILRFATQRVSSAGFVDNLQLNISADINCTAGQTLRLFTEQNSGSSQFVFGAFYSWFNMHKLY